MIPAISVLTFTLRAGDFSPKGKNLTFHVFYKFPRISLPRSVTKTDGNSPDVLPEVDWLLKTQKSIARAFLELLF